MGMGNHMWELPVDTFKAVMKVSTLFGLSRRS